MSVDWFDAHLDLAYLAECGRDMLAPLDTGAAPHPPAAVTLPALREGRVTACLGTIFTEAHAPGQTPEYARVAYPIGDAEAAHRAGLRQVERYRAWEEQGWVSVLTLQGGKSDAPCSSAPPGREGREELLSRGGSEPRPLATIARPPGEQPRPLIASSPHPPLALAILMEGADPIRTPEELPFWAERGVAAIGLTWARGSRYAAGNHDPAPGGERGLTRLGFAMLGAMDALRIVHDLSHLSWPAMDDLLETTDARVIASHSNCAAVFQGLSRQNERHLRDEVIREIARRGGVVGINLFSKFLRDPRQGEGVAPDAAPWRASVEDVVRHIEHICEVAGSARHVGLGSDMDGGFGSSWLPDRITRPADLRLIAGALSHLGWKDADIDAFAWGNWADFWGMRAVDKKQA